MCGISGFASFARPRDLAGYYAAHLGLRHRGEDDEGFLVAAAGVVTPCRGDDTIHSLAHLPHIASVEQADVVLGHRRLSIIDLTAAGHQPMRDPSGRFAVTYNGEIYNYIELRRELQALGDTFASGSDTEVLLKAYMRWGTSCFNRFNGMWALAIHDAVEERLLLCRDRFGVKPLYYAMVDGTLFFASEVKFLLPFLPAVRVNQPRAMEYLVSGLVDHHEETLFEGVRQLRPSTWLRFDRSGVYQEPYWDIPQSRTATDYDAAVARLDELLTSAVDLRLRSDVPVGSLLSGGLDSTTVVCLVRRLLDARGATNAFECFSAVFDEERYSERRYIEATARQVGMPVHWVHPQPDGIEAALGDMLHCHEFPFRSLAVFSQWELMRAIRATPIKVLLNGQGSDEIFAGYGSHLAAVAAEHVRTCHFARAWAEWRGMVAHRRFGPMQALSMVGYEWLRHAGWDDALHSILLPYVRGRYRADRRWQRHPSLLTDRLLHDLTCSALPEYLRYEDRNSMAFTLETRLPFLDYRLVEWAFSLPDDWKIADCRSKRVLRDFASRLVPREVWSRTDKMGFVSPQEVWQRSALRDAVRRELESDFEAAFPWVNRRRLMGVYADYVADKHNNWQFVWRAFSLMRWFDHWIGGNQDSHSSGARCRT